MAKRHTTRRVSAGAALVTGLGTVGIGLFAAAPAQADVSNTLNYSCELTNAGLEMAFQDPWVVDLNVATPDSVEPGQEIEAPAITADVTPGADAAQQLRGLNVQTLEGTSTTNYTFNGEDRTADLTIPTTDVPAEGPITTTASGTGQAETAPSEAGEVPITAGDFTADLTTDSGFVLNIACDAPADNTVGTIPVGDAGGDDGDDGDDGTETPEMNDWFDEPGSLPLVDNVFTVEGTASQAGTLVIEVLDANKEQLTSYTWEVEEGEVSKGFDLVEGANYVRILSEDCVDANGADSSVHPSGCSVEYVAPWAEDTGDGDDQGDDGDDQGDDGDDQGDDTGDGDDKGDDTGDGDDKGDDGDDQGDDTGDDADDKGDDQGDDADDKGDDTGDDADDKGDDTGDDADDKGDDQGDDAAGDDKGGDDAGQPEVPEVVQTDGGAMKDAGATNAALGLGGLVLVGAAAGSFMIRRRRAEQL